MSDNLPSTVLDEPAVDAASSRCNTANAPCGAVRSLPTLSARAVEILESLNGLLGVDGPSEDDRDRDRLPHSP